MSIPPYSGTVVKGLALRATGSARVASSVTGFVDECCQGGARLLRRIDLCTGVTTPFHTCLAMVYRVPGVNPFVTNLTHLLINRRISPFASDLKVTHLMSPWAHHSRTFVGFAGVTPSVMKSTRCS